MKLKVVYTTQLKAAVGMGCEAVEVESGCRVPQLLEHLGTRHGQAFRRMVLDSDGNLLPSILLCVGEEQVRGDDQRQLQDGDEITILSAISGG